VTKEQEILSASLAEIDRRCAELEMVLSTLPPDAQCCCGCQREELEAELSALWRFRLELDRQLGQTAPLYRAGLTWLCSSRS
jgi:hypothetical protein